MSDESNGNSSTLLSLPAILIALAFAGGLLWHNTLLKSPRPGGEPQLGLEIEREQRVEARMWEDPVTAVAHATQGHGDTEGSESAGWGAFGNPPIFMPVPRSRRWIDSEAFGSLLATRLKRDQNPEGVGVQILLAIVPGTMYAEDMEDRLRLREGVVAALSNAGYRPEDEKRIGALRLGWPTLESKFSERPEPAVKSADITLISAEMKTETTPSVFLPFEWFRMRTNVARKHTGPDCALVLWLPDTLFEGNPLIRLSALNALIKSFNAHDKHSSVNILGPLGSSMLRKMLPSNGDIQNGASPALEAVLDGVKLYSWSATAMDELLAPRSQQRKPRTAIKEYMKKKWGLDFINVSATDDQLAAELFDELKLRNVDLSDPKQHAALIFESDTFYGRTIPVSFVAQVRLMQLDRMGCAVRPLPAMIESVFQVLKTPECRSPRAMSGAVSNVHSYSYLRGIDGKLLKEPGDFGQSSSRNAGPSGAKNQSKDNEEEMNRAEGQNQLDYIPRLALDLQNLERELSRGDLETDHGPGQRFLR
jgi:hypothetical protein